jgi:hypothetical protein
MPGTTTIAPSRPAQADAADARLDVAGLLRAMRARDAAAWSDYFAADAQWLVYHHHDPPIDPIRLEGNVSVHERLSEICGSDAHLHIEDLVVGDGSIWLRRMMRLGSGEMVIEHVHLRLVGGRIVREIDVCSWDYA